MRARPVFAFVAAVIGLFATETASACSCVRVGRQTVLDRAVVAFRGEITSAHPSADGRDVVAAVRVLRVIKGRVPHRITVTSTAIPGLCGYPLHPGATLDFAGRPDAAGRLDVDMCDMVPLNPTPRPPVPR